MMLLSNSMGHMGRQRTNKAREEERRPKKERRIWVPWLQAHKFSTTWVLQVWSNVSHV
jgi:hypothetical protein